MEITPQVLIDKEFRVKLRGFDKAEVSAFLEEVAENFSKLIEENDHLSEKITALEEKIQSGGVGGSQPQIKFPVELKNFLKELKQDTTSINKDISALKQDRSAFDSLEKSLKESVASLQSFTETASERKETELPADLQPVLQDFTKTAEALNVELAGLKESWQSLASLENSLKEAVTSLQITATSVSEQEETELPAGLQTVLQDFTQGTEAINTELAGLKEAVTSLQSTAASVAEHKETELPADLQTVLQDFSKGTEEINAELAGLKEGRQSFDLLQKNIEQILAVINDSGLAPSLQAKAESSDLTKTIAADLADFKEKMATIQQFHEEIKDDMQEIFNSHFDDLAAKLAQAAPPLPKKAKGAKAEPLKAAIIEEEPEGQPEEQKPAGFDMAAFTPEEDEELEFLSEDDILDVDKLRGVFQSVLDDSLSDAPTTREDEEETASDLLFFDDDFLEVMNE